MCLGVCMIQVILVRQVENQASVPCRMAWVWSEEDHYITLLDVQVSLMIISPEPGTHSVISEYMVLQQF